MQAESNRTWNVGDIILDLYRVTGILGEGGFGKVYKVRHTGWNVDLAMKFPRPEIVENVGGVENFEREAETWVNLGLHPHTVSCYYVRRVEGNPLVFAEYVDGGSLYDWIYQRKLYEGGEQAALKRILDIAIQFAWGLHYAHEQGLIHQDVKPGNVMLTPQGKVKVTDFGLAGGKYITNQIDRTLMKENNMLMTWEYCSPEQAIGEPLTRRTDLWSWALSVLTMLTDLDEEGRVPWKDRPGSIGAYVLEKYLNKEIENPLLSQMPESVADLLRRCFRENPEERPHTMLDVAVELQEIYQQETGEVYPQQKAETAKDIADSLNNRAVSLLDLGKQEEALKLWDRALQVEKHHPESTYNRGLVLWRTARITDATLLWEMEKVRTAYAGNWWCDYLMALVHLEQDNCAAAIKILESLEKLVPDREEIQAALREAQQRLPHSKQFVRILEGHTEEVRSISLSADGRSILSASADKTIKLWDTATDQCLQTFEGHTEEVYLASMSADDRFIVSASVDKTLKLWEVATGQCLLTFEIPTHTVIRSYLDTHAVLVLSVNSSQILALWDIAKGQCLQTFEGGNSDLTDLSVDGRFVLSKNGDKTLGLYEVSTGGCLHSFEVDTANVRSVKLSADNRFVITGDRDNTLKLWEVSTGRCLRTFKGHGGPEYTGIRDYRDGVWSVSLSTDGRFAISGGSDKTLRLWEVATGRCLRTFAAPAGKAGKGNPDVRRIGHKVDLVKAVDLSRDGQFAVSISADIAPRLWAVNLGTSSYVAPMQLCRILPTETLLSSDFIYERELEQAAEAMGKGDVVMAAKHLRIARSQPGYKREAKAFFNWGSLYLWLPHKGFIGAWQVGNFVGHADAVNAVSVDTNDSWSTKRFALSGSNDGTIKLWEIFTGNCLLTILGEDPRPITTPPNSPAIRRESVSLQSPKSRVDSVCLSGDGKLALFGGRDATLKLWDITQSICLCNLKGHKVAVQSMCLSADSRFVLSGGWEGTVKLWEIATGLCLQTFVGHLGGTSPQVKSYGSFVRMSSCRFRVSAGPAGGASTADISGVSSVCLSSDSTLALSGGAIDKTLRLWDVATGRCLKVFKGHTWGVRSVCLSADGRFALSGSLDKTLKLWDITNGSCLRTFEGHTGAVTSVCFSIDNRFALSGSSDHTVKLWEIATGLCLCTLEGHTGIVQSVCLSSDGLFAISASMDGTIKIWFLDWELEERYPVDWDEGARPYLENFLRQHIPYAATLPDNREPTTEEITLALTRRGIPTWTEPDFHNLLKTLGSAGYGYLTPEGVHLQLKAIAADREALSPLLEKIDKDSIEETTFYSPLNPEIETEDGGQSLEEDMVPEPLSLESITPQDWKLLAMQAQDRQKRIQKPNREEEMPLYSPSLTEAVQGNQTELIVEEIIPPQTSQNRPVWRLSRRHRVALVTFLCAYICQVAILVSAFGLGGGGSLLLPIVPAIMLTIAIAQFFE